MGTWKRQIDKNNSICKWAWTLSSLLLLFSLLFVHNLCHYTANAHFIQIDHNEYRASGYPRPILPPPPLPPPIEQFPQHLRPPPVKELTPVELMVDLTNDLTYCILHYHSILNRNNFAYSPTALVSILVALYEGSAGRSALELKNVLHLPDNKDILRVGYRDIHRRLRTYFFGSENPLKGLSLNKDNVTISRDYETILMFYGYDLGIDMISSVAMTAPASTTSSTTETSVESTVSTTISTDNNTTTLNSTKETTTVPPESLVTTLLPMSIEETTAATEITEKITTSNSPMTTLPTTTLSTTILPTTTTEKAEETTKTEAPNSTEEPTTTVATAEETVTTEVPATTTESEAKAEDDAATTVEEAAELISSPSTGEPFLRIQQKTSTTRLPSGRLQAPPRPQVSSSSLSSASTTRSPQKPSVRTQTIQFRSKPLMSMKLTTPKTNNSTHAQVSVPRNDYLPATSRTFQSERILSLRQGRQKRHLFGSFKDADANLFVTLFQPSQPHHHNLYTISGSGPGPALSHITNEYEVEIEPQFITGPGTFAASGPTETKQNYNTDIISHIFYLGSQEVIHTTYKVYNAVLYFKYFEHLKMSVLELELDTPEYNLMILLPDFHTDLVSAAASLSLGPTLRVLRKQLKPRWVQAIIPDFKLDGSIFLTNDLQNLGICDLFEPSRADFRPMTDEKGIYVKHIEQSINVNIRTHPINQLRRNYGAAQQHPIQISVNHPFLFFIVDRDLDVAVMAGRILNPLNVRIQ